MWEHKYFNDFSLEDHDGSADIKLIQERWVPFITRQCVPEPKRLCQDGCGDWDLSTDMKNTRNWLFIFVNLTFLSRCSQYEKITLNRL